MAMQEPAVTTQQIDVSIRQIKSDYPTKRGHG